MLATLVSQRRARVAPTPCSTEANSYGRPTGDRLPSLRNPPRRPGRGGRSDQLRPDYKELGTARHVTFVRDRRDSGAIVE